MWPVGHFRFTKWVHANAPNHAYSSGPNKIDRLVAISPKFKLFYI